MTLTAFLDPDREERPTCLRPFLQGGRAFHLISSLRRAFSAMSFNPFRMFATSPVSSLQRGLVRLNMSTTIFQFAPVLCHKITYFPSISCEFLLFVDFPISKIASPPRLCTFTVVSLRSLTALTLFSQNDFMAGRPWRR